MSIFNRRKFLTASATAAATISGPAVAFAQIKRKFRVRVLGTHVTLQEPLRIRAEKELGIEPKFQARIFEMFKRLHRQSKIEGTGMGLALVKKIVQQAGGTIEVESAENQGACFIFTWPVELPPTSDVENIATSAVGKD